MDKVSNIATRLVSYFTGVYSPFIIKTEFVFRAMKDEFPELVVMTSLVN